jgi:hypothetical protein
MVTLTEGDCVWSLYGLVELITDRSKVKATEIVASLILSNRVVSKEFEPRVPKTNRPCKLESDTQCVLAILVNPTLISELQSVFPNEDPIIVMLANAVWAIFTFGGSATQAICSNWLSWRFSGFPPIEAIQPTESFKYNARCFDSQSPLLLNRASAIVWKLKNSEMVDTLAPAVTRTLKVGLTPDATLTLVHESEIQNEASLMLRPTVSETEKEDTPNPAAARLTLMLPVLAKFDRLDVLTPTTSYDKTKVPVPATALENITLLLLDTPWGLFVETAVSETHRLRWFFEFPTETRSVDAADA